MNKRFLSVRSLDTKMVGSLGKQKTCKNCDHPATKEAIFDTGNDISILERYCEPCLDVMLKELRSVA